MGDSETLIQRAARAGHEVNRAFCDAIGDDSQRPWEAALDWQQHSAIRGALAIKGNPSITSEELHNKWMEDKFLNGWNWGPVKDIEKKEHCCLVPYHKLPAEQRAKDKLFGAAVRGVLGI